MKKLILSFVLLFTVTLSYSQLFNVGIKAGYNSSLSFSSLGSGVSYNSQNFASEFFGNMHFGAFGRLNFGKIYLQPELLYSLQKQDYKIDDAASGFSFDNVIKLRMIDVPILVGYKLLDLKLINVRAFAGPKFRFNAGSSLDFKNITGGIDKDDLLEDFQGAKVGLEAGVGIDALMFTFDIRYNLIGNLYETNLRNIGTALKGIPSSTFLFTLGWKIL